MKLKITTLVIVHDGEVQDIYHSLNDNIEKAKLEILNRVNGEYGDSDYLDENQIPVRFKSIEDLKKDFDHVTIETQELTSTGFKTAILDS